MGEAKDHERRHVDRSLEAIQDDMEQTRYALTDKLEELEHRVTDKIETVRSKYEGAVDTVKRTFDLPYQVRRHPWPMFGASVAAGIVLARLTGGREPGPRALNGANDVGGTDFHAPVPKRRYDGLFADELHYLQRAAVGAVMSLVKDSLVRSFPQMAPQTERVIDGITRKLGGEPVAPGFRDPID
jgi:hypothetical protein